MDYRCGDIVKFGYGERRNGVGKYSIYRTILLLEKVDETPYNQSWRAELMNDTNGYYSDNCKVFSISNSDKIELIWRKE